MFCTFMKGDHMSEFHKEQFATTLPKPMKEGEIKK